MHQWNCFCCTFKWAKANRLTNVKSRREQIERILRSLLPSCNDANTLGTDFNHVNMTAAALRPLFTMLFTAPPLCAHTFAYYTRGYIPTHAPGEPAGHAACTLHTVMHCWISKEITLHLGARILASSLTRGMGFEPGRFPQGSYLGPSPEQCAG